MADATIQVGKKRRFEVSFTTDAGAVAAVDGPADAVSTDESKGTIEDLEQVIRAVDGGVIGLKGSLRAIDIGDVQVHVNATENGNPITIIGSATIAEGIVTGGSFVFGGADED